MWPSPDDFVWKDSLDAPETWNKPGLVMFFNLECPACISRGIPFLKRLVHKHQDKFNVVLIHTSFGHKQYKRSEVEPTLKKFAESFANLPFPVALDLDASIAEHWQALGTPHWLVFDQEGALLRSIYGSQDNAQTRLEYLVEEMLEADSKTSTS